MSFQKLLKACKQNNREAQKQLYERFAPKMLLVASRYCRSIQEAEDVLQESFIKVFRTLSSLNSESRIEGWIRKIVVNTALNQNRSKLYLFPMTEVQEYTSVTDSDVSVSGLHFEELLGKVQSLPDGCRIIFNLYAIEGFTHKEIAEKLKISEGTSKSQYARARQLLIEMIEKSHNVNYGGV